MKIIVGVVAVILLVNGCGLFKKNTKIKQSEINENISAMELDLKKEKEIVVTTETDLQSFVWLDGETVMQLEGEDVRIEKDGTVLMARGKVNQKSREKSNVVQSMTKTTKVEQHEKKQTALETKQKVTFEKKASSLVSKPESSMIFWFYISLFILIFICLCWIKKKIR
ncbi:hypothetical protein SF1_25600 [Sphingobacterium faecium NBRC 15299]|uniref:hypothetical protein n=1 Tax=Sphingobacterium faecium TaxID=34087 RepID=UPI000D3A579C|nr:hypothetical protein [Sphingobacterium faecium]PTX11552.1 hypothetical protein C8N37_103125 [Sphingobacterium faecium]GEM64578.1 hypothetical protein SF1_25600 [Sphingobacterium faecium NBRC 15299]